MPCYALIAYDTPDSLPARLAARPAHLARLDDSRRRAAFARAWSAREATLKLHGQPLREWCEADAQLRADCHPLALPPGWVGTLALPAPVPA